MYSDVSVHSVLFSRLNYVRVAETVEQFDFFFLKLLRKLFEKEWKSIEIYLE